MVIEPDWRHVHVDDAFHRSYRVAGWPQLPVPSDWLSRLLAAGAVPPGGVPMAMVAADSAVHSTRALPSLFSGDLLDVTCVPVSLPLA